MPTTLQFEIFSSSDFLKRDDKGNKSIELAVVFSVCMCVCVCVCVCETWSVILREQHTCMLRGFENSAEDAGIKGRWRK